MFVRTTIASAVVAGALALSASPAVATSTVRCGQTLTRSVKLANDLKNCPAGGLVIGADGITVDLNGHTIDGTVAQGTPACDFTPGPAGIDNEAGHDRLTIEDGTVQQFTTGFSAGSGTTGMADSSVHDLTVRDNRSGGISIGSGQRLNNNNRIEHNVTTGNGCGHGITLNQAHGNHVARNRVENNGGGLLICCSDHNVVENNTLSGNRDEGILVCCEPDSYNVIQHNAMRGNGGPGIIECCQDGDQHDRIVDNEISDNEVGIVLEGANGNEVARNRVVRNHDDIAVFGDRNTVVANRIADTVGGCDGCGTGILVGAGAGNLIAANVISGTLLDGIHVVAFEPDSATTATVVRDNLIADAKADGLSVAIEGEGTVSGTLLQRNVATGSGDDGFDVRSPMTTLTANLAVRNRDLGIFAIPGVTDGGHNKAVANGNRAQCVGVAC